MANIYVEGKGPKEPQIKESLQLASVPSAAVSRGLAVAFNTDAYHIAVVAAAGAAAIGILEEDVISTTQAGVTSVGQPSAVIEFGHAVGQIGANISINQPLTTNSNGQLVPAQPGQPIVAIALEAQTYVSPGSFACVFVVAILGQTMQGGVNYVTASGSISIATGTVVLNGAAALAMTLAQPTAAQDGTRIFITALTAHAHTVTTPANGIDGNKHVVIFAAQGDFVEFEAVNGGWQLRGLGGPTPAALS